MGAIGPQYYVHYKGWKEKWNEWVSAERLLKKTPQNLRLQASLKAAHPHLSRARSRSGQILGRSGDKCQEDGKEEAKEQVIKLLYGWYFFCVLRIADLNGKKDEGNRKLDNIRVNVPSSLKHKLVRDRGAIAIHSQVSSRPPCSAVLSIESHVPQLVLLPRVPTIYAEGNGSSALKLVVSCPDRHGKA